MRSCASPSFQVPHTRHEQDQAHSGLRDGSRGTARDGHAAGFIEPFCDRGERQIELGLWLNVRQIGAFLFVFEGEHVKKLAADLRYLAASWRSLFPSSRNTSSVRAPGKAFGCCVETAPRRFRVCDESKKFFLWGLVTHVQRCFVSSAPTPPSRFWGHDIRSRRRPLARCARSQPPVWLRFLLSRHSTRSAAAFRLL